MNVHPNFPEELVFTREQERRHAARAFLHRHRWFLAFVILPTLLAALYYGFFASDQFVSESRFVVKSTGDRGRQVSSLASLIQTTGLSRGQEETNAVMDYVRSRDGLADLQKKMDVRAVFADPAADRLSRFPFPGWDGTKFENLYDYYRGKVETHLDTDSGLAVLNVKAFDPAAAQAMNGHLLDLSETLVNRLNRRAQETGIAEAERRVREAQSRLLAARVAMARFRNSQGIIDPQVQAGGLFGVVTQLTAQRAALQAQLDQVQRQAPDNPQAESLRGQIAAVSGELDGLMARMVGGSGALASKLGAYENFLVEQEFAATMLTAANAELEQARTEAQKQQFYLERVVEPNRADLALYPKRLFAVLTVLGVALCLYMVGWMLVVGILEHSPDK